MAINLDRLVALIQRFEGFPNHNGIGYAYDDKDGHWPRLPVARSACYLDQQRGQFKVHATGGTVTIGWGETAAAFVDQWWDEGLPRAEADRRLGFRAMGFVDDVTGCIDRALTPHQWEACACRAYQAGGAGFCRSEVVKYLNAGDFTRALHAWVAVFAHPDRSEAEVAHFLTPDIGTPDEWAALFVPVLVA